MRNQQGKVSTAIGRAAWVWAGLGVVLALYVFCALRVGPVSNFGTVQDDALYFSSAKALAQGRGYIQPSFPVRLSARKYPELYPLLLAGVWKLDSHFPGNVNLAVAMTLGFGCAALVFAFLLLREWPGFDDWQALAVASLCAFSGYFLDLSASVMTDVPFLALMLGAFWLAERRSKRPVTSALSAGVLAGLTVGFRTLGAAPIAGIGLVLLARREYRRLFWYSAAAAPLALFWMWPTIGAVLHLTVGRAGVSAGNTGWTQTLCYYTSYACAWKLGMKGPGALQAMILTNLKSVIQQPGLYLLSPLAAAGGLWRLVLVTLASIVSYFGIARYVRNVGWQPYPTTILLYLLVILPWPYTPGRFLLSFLPLFFGGFWLEGRHFVHMAREHLRSTHTGSERVTAGAMAAVAAVLATMVLANYVHAIPAKVKGFAVHDAALLTDRRGAYQWIREHTAPGARVIAYQDGLLYLYTGRRSILPIARLTQAFYLRDPRYAEHDAAHLADVARHIDADFWLTSRQDYSLDGKLDYSILTRKQKELLSAAPVVYRSADGNVTLYDTHCLWKAAMKGCTQPKTNANTEMSRRNLAAVGKVKHQ